VEKMEVNELMRIIMSDDVLRLKAALKKDIQYDELYKEDLLVYYACSYGAEKAALELIRKGKRFDASIDGVTALMTSCSRGLESVVEEIIDMAPEELYQKDKNGATAFIYAITSSNTTIVDFLLKKGANIHQVDERGNNGLDFAQINFECYRVMDYLLDKGIKPRHETIQMACISTGTEAIKAYLKHYDKLNDKNKELLKKVRVRLLYK